jgi:hypothetical protein
MERIAAAMASLLRWTAARLPAGRREWVEAVLAEVGDVPAGSARLSWLAGGLWLVAREAGMIRRIGYAAAGLVVGASFVWLDWHPGSANPAMPTNRITMISIMVMLAVLPWITRPVLGPVADNRVARIVRAGGYAAIYAQLLVMVGLSRFAGSRFDHFQAFDQSNWEADMRSGAVVSAVLIVTLIGGYAVAILAVTARRTSVAPTTLAIGTALGVGAALIVYALMPLGNAMHPNNGLVAAGYGIVLAVVAPGALAAAGLLAGRSIATLQAARGHAGGVVSEPAEPARLRRGNIAGLYVGGMAALLLNILTIGTMLLLPGHVDLKWANPDPNATHGTTFEVQMSVGDAAIKYEVGLLLGPLIGFVLGAIGGNGLAGSSEPSRRTQRREEPDLAPTP